MDENSRKVLDMLAEGKITADEAERLLERLSHIPTAAATEASADAPATEADGPAPDKPKYLRVIVQSQDGDNVNIRVPMALVKTGIRLGALMPSHARQELEGKGVDLSALSELDGEELARALAELQVDVDSSDGDQVRIFCE